MLDETVYICCCRDRQYPLKYYLHGLYYHLAPQYHHHHYDHYGQESPDHHLRSTNLSRHHFAYSDFSASQRFQARSCVAPEARKVNPNAALSSLANNIYYQQNNPVFEQNEFVITYPFTSSSWHVFSFCVCQNIVFSLILLVILIKLTRRQASTTSWL